jgi:nitrile hydratase accessory protein
MTSDLVYGEGSAAPPRNNGELVFSEPWESTAFSLAVALQESGVFTAEEFRSRLAASIAAWERRPAGDWSYYARWLEALEGLLLERGIVADGELRERVGELAHHDHHDHG